MHQGTDKGVRYFANVSLKNRENSEVHPSSPSNRHSSLKLNFIMTEKDMLTAFIEAVFCIIHLSYKACQNKIFRPVSFLE